MGRSFRDSLKVLEADIQHANSIASEFRREYDGACLQMRMAYCPAAHFFLFLVQWTDCSLAGALGLLRILIYKVYADGTTTMSTHERKASIREFYAVIFPSLMQLHEGINEVEDKKQKAICIERYRRRDDDQKTVISEIDDTIEEECGICMEINSRVVLPTCSHAMCIKCYRNWWLFCQFLLTLSFPLHCSIINPYTLLILNHGPNYHFALLAIVDFIVMPLCSISCWLIVAYA